MSISSAVARLVIAVVLGASFGTVLCPAREAHPRACFVYVANNNPTISIYSIDRKTGALTDEGTATLGSGSSAFTLAINPSQTFLYVGDNSNTSGTRGFSVDDDSGALRPLSGSPFGFFNALSLAVDPSGHFLIAALGDNVSSLRINSATGDLAEVDTAIGGTPSSLTFDSSGRYIYVANVNSNSVSGFRLDRNSGKLAAVPGSPFPAGAGPFGIAAEHSGRLLYVSNINGSDLSAYKIDPASGTLSELSSSPFPTEDVPRSIAIEPSGRYLYVSTLLNIEGFSIDSDTGALTRLSGSPFPSGDSSALDLKVDPSGRFLYAANHDASEVTVFEVNADTGGLKLLSSVTSPGFPLAISFATCERKEHHRRHGTRHAEDRDM